MGAATGVERGCAHSRAAKLGRQAFSPLPRRRPASLGGGTEVRGKPCVSLESFHDESPKAGRCRLFPCRHPRPSARIIHTAPSLPRPAPLAAPNRRSPPLSCTTTPTRPPPWRLPKMRNLPPLRARYPVPAVSDTGDVFASRPLTSSPPTPAGSAWRARRSRPESRVGGCPIRGWSSGGCCRGEEQSFAGLPAVGVEGSSAVEDRSTIAGLERGAAERGA